MASDCELGLCSALTAASALRTSESGISETRPLAQFLFALIEMSYSAQARYAFRFSYWCFFSTGCMLLGWLAHLS